MATVEVILLPRDLEPKHLLERSLVVFDVLRATTSITAALAAGVKEIRIFPDLAAATRAAREHGGDHEQGRLLCGEENCLPPKGFDLGNSPGAFSPSLHAGRTLYMSTTNGTGAIAAAQGADALFAGALVNAAAIAGALARRGLDVTLLCAGTNGKIAMEDVLGAGAVIQALQSRAALRFASDAPLMALRLFETVRNDLPSALAQTQGGRNVIAAGLGADVKFAAALDSLSVVGIVKGQPPIVTALGAD